MYAHAGKHKRGKRRSSKKVEECWRAKRIHLTACNGTVHSTAASISNYTQHL